MTSEVCTVGENYLLLTHSRINKSDALSTLHARKQTITQRSAAMARTRKDLVLTLTLICDLGAGVIKNVRHAMSNEEAYVYEVSLN